MRGKRLEEVIDGVYMLKRMMGSNVFLIPGKPSVMIDAGFPFDAGRVLKQILGNGYDPPDLLIATHYHLDHTGSMLHLKQMLGSKVAAHDNDSGYIEGKQKHEVFRVDAPRRAYYRLLTPFFRNKSVDVDVKLKEGDVIDCLGGLKVIHIPGHTVGSIALYQKERGIIFTGDTIRNENGVLEGPPLQFTPEPERSYFNIRYKICELPFEIIMPGHGNPVFDKGWKKVAHMLKDNGRFT